MTNGQKRKYFIILLLVTVLLVAAAGYYFATLKSEPQYLSKIDRIMFDKKNQSPKFILTLPDKTPKKKVEPQEEDVAEQAPKEPPVTIEDFVTRAPLVSKLPDFKDQKPLKYIEQDDDLIEEVAPFTLPKMTKNGRKPWIEYGQRVTVAPNFSKVSVVVQKVGLDDSVTRAVVSALPSEVSLSFSPYAVNAAEKIKNARNHGHETYVDLLLSSPDVLKSDNGPLSMSLTLKPEENLMRLRQTLSVEAPIGGVVVNDGVADNDTSAQLKSFLTELKNRGLLMIDAISNQEISKLFEAGLARKKAEIVLDDSTLTPSAIEEKLKEAERLSQENGQVMIVAAPKPIIITALSNWFKTFSKQLSYEQMKEQNITSFEKPFALVPVSNLVVE